MIDEDPLEVVILFRRAELWPLIKLVFKVIIFGKCVFTIQQEQPSQSMDM